MSQAIIFKNEQERLATVVQSGTSVALTEADLQMMVALRQLRTFFLNGKFNLATNMLTEKLNRDCDNLE